MNGTEYALGRVRTWDHLDLSVAIVGPEVALPAGESLHGVFEDAIRV